MKPFLLDVNVLVALMWPKHVHHNLAKDWFKLHRSAGFRTCPFTQAGALRIFSNPRYSSDRATLVDAVEVLSRFINLPEHSFWQADLPVIRAIELSGRISGHQQITDAYLAAIAISHGGVLATLDRGLLALTEARGSVELIS